MADPKARDEAAKWIREVFLPKKYGQKFSQKSLELQSRAQARFDAVSEDGEIVAAICTSAGHSPNGKVAINELQKVRSNALQFLMLDARPQKRLMIFTDQSMVDVVKDEKKKGSFPSDLEIVKVKLPANMAARFESDEVAPDEHPD